MLREDEGCIPAESECEGLGGTLTFTGSRGLMGVRGLKDGGRGPCLLKCMACDIKYMEMKNLTY